MQQATDLLPQAQKSLAPTSPGQKTSTRTTKTSVSDTELVNVIFDRLQSIFTKWREIWATDGEVAAAKRQWVRELIHRRVTDPELIKAGLRTARATGWVRPPSAGQFADWCIDYAMEQAGIPTIGEADQAIDRKLRGMTQPMTGALFQLSTYLDWFELRRADQQTITIRVKTAHKRMVDHWMAGAPWDEPPTAIEDQSDEPRGPLTASMKSKAASEFAKLRETMQGAKTHG